MILLDTNIFLRLVIPDDRKRADRCEKLLEAVAEGRESAVVTPMAIAEIAWVLLGFCRLPKPRVIEALRRILNTAKLKVVERETVLRGLEFFETHEMDFIDAYHAAFLEAHGITTIYSYDTDFDQVPGITRREP
jgi:predicted nucleic acid-binding protein